jgi:thioesterase domain-containing protein
MFDSPYPPNFPDPGNADTPLDETDLLAEFLQDLRLRFAETFEPDQDVSDLKIDFRQLNLDEQLNYVVEQAKMLESVLPEGGLPQLHRLMQIFKANVRAIRRYIPRFYPGRIIFFQASEQREHNAAIDPISGWQKLSKEPLEDHSIPGSHYTMLAEPNVQILAKQLKEYILSSLPLTPH